MKKSTMLAALAAVILSTAASAFVDDPVSSLPSDQQAGTSAAPFQGNAHIRSASFGENSARVFKAILDGNLDGLFNGTNADRGVVEAGSAASKSNKGNNDYSGGISEAVLKTTPGHPAGFKIIPVAYDKCFDGNGCARLPPFRPSLPAGPAPQPHPAPQPQPQPQPRPQTQPQPKPQPGPGKKPA